MKIYTDAVNSNGYFDARYTCDVDNSSPELRWEDPPAGTAGFVVIAEDPDVPGEPFAHWVVYNIPPDIRHLPTGIPPQDTLPNGIRQGVNGFRKLGYLGPCPPRGSKAHHYIIRIYALRAIPELQPRCTREQCLEAIRDMVIESAEIVGLYQRQFERAG